MGFDYIPRDLENKIENIGKKFKAIFVIGPRQAGKTTLVRHMFKDYPYFNLETPDVLVEAKDNPRAILQNKYLVLDEIQNAPWLLSYLLELLDTNKVKHVVLTGSQSLLISNQITQTLAGRVLVTELYPFTVEEVKHHLNNNLPSVLFFGFYPQPLLEHDPMLSSAWYKSYLATYVERDIRSLQNIKDLANFYKFLNLLAAQVGQILNLSAISTQLGVSVNTLKEWLSLLEATFTVFLLKPYHPNIKKRFIRMPKVYFWDTGLLIYLLKISSPENLSLSPLYGQIFENFVISDIFKTIKHNLINVDLYFLRDHSGHEIDLVVEASPEILFGVEIKASQTVMPRHLEGLKYYSNLLPISAKYAVYASTDKDYLKQMNILHSEVEISSWKEIANRLKARLF